MPPALQIPRPNPDAAAAVPVVEAFISCPEDGGIVRYKHLAIITYAFKIARCNRSLYYPRRRSPGD
jgi:hypothetical protein